MIAALYSRKSYYRVYHDSWLQSMVTEPQRFVRRQQFTTGSTGHSNLPAYHVARSGRAIPHPTIPTENPSKDWNAPPDLTSQNIPHVPRAPSLREMQIQDGANKKGDVKTLLGSWKYVPNKNPSTRHEKPFKSCSSKESKRFSKPYKLFLWPWWPSRGNHLL